MASHPAQPAPSLGVIHRTVSGNPAWMPSPGHSATVPEVNTFHSIQPPESGPLGYSHGWRHERAILVRIAVAGGWKRIINDFSGGVYNPHYQHTSGRFGCLVFHGGGHSATNWNGIAIFDFNSLQYFIVCPGSENIWPAEPTERGVDLLSTEGTDGQPGAPHTYDTLEILGPEHGYPKGALITCYRAAYFHSNANSPCVHIFDFSQPSRRWQRKWLPPDVKWKAFTSGYASALDTSNQVVWTVGGGNGRQLYRYDVSAGVQTKYTTSNARTATGVHPDCFTLRYVARRSLLVYSCVVMSESKPTARRLQYMSTSGISPSWNTAILSSELPIGTHPLGICWVDKSRAFYVRCKGYSNVLFKIEVPSNPAEPWPVTEVPLNGPDFPDAPASGGVLGRRFDWSEPLGAIVYKATATDPIQVYVPT